MSATLFLVPSTLGELAPIDTLPASTLSALRGLQHWVVETPKQARRFLKAGGVALSDRRLDIKVLDEHTPDARLPELLAPALAGFDIGILSDAGCPAVADPGARLVRLAHEHALTVVPLVGPSAILLALMASGLTGQRFVFHGYLPIEPPERARALREIERISAERDETQVMIETPYRNQQLLAAMLSVCRDRTSLCVAVDLTLPGQSVATKTIAQWRSAPAFLGKRPAVFLINAGPSVSARRYTRSRS